MESVPHLSSHDDPGQVQLEGFGPTGNRKVVGLNPTSGSKKPQLSGHFPRLFLLELGRVAASLLFLRLPRLNVARQPRTTQGSVKVPECLVHGLVMPRRGRTRVASRALRRRAAAMLG